MSSPPTPEPPPGPPEPLIAEPARAGGAPGGGSCGPGGGSGVGWGAYKVIRSGGRWRGNFFFLLLYRGSNGL